ncbi:hypothetical protein [Geomesophilobacter sediminis]|uniref:Uncharacterized protein n=1 Tax=Geomesophilobacter sediminis TaxID=2798584 RepID=A0A8J7M1Y5_9BACT|nr:hypothetical protein [Geomesophilobacter sediminis]MBJ6727200.1 hypothetical protein [Geomesophilobacter sediminis]
MGLSPTELATAVAAIGALGTAAFGLVDATKALWGGVSRSGFEFISRFLNLVAPNDKGIPHGSAVTSSAIRETLMGSWLNGASPSDFKSTAKSLIKLRLNSETAPDLARCTGVDAEILSSVAAILDSGKALTQEQLNVYGRFDLLLSTMIDRAYQRADQRYRNNCKAFACVLAITLAEIAAWSLYVSAPEYRDGATFLFAFIAGLLATPFAPVAKDLASSIGTAAKAIQAAKGKP